MIRSTRLGAFACSLLLVMVGLIASSAPAHAQSSGQGSIYSRYGLGTLRGAGSSQAQALGGGGFALRSLNYVGFSNPALWSDQVLARVSGSAEYRTVQTTSASGAETQVAGGTFDALRLSFPVLSERLGIGFAFQPFSRANYRVQRSGALPPNTVRDTTTGYTVTFEGRGGLQRITGGAGYRVNEWLSVGARVDYLFGIIENGRRTSFADPAFDGTNLTEATRLRGVTGTIGVHFALADVLSDDDALSIGGAVTLPTTLQGTRTRTLDESLDRDTLRVFNGQPQQDGSVRLPLRSRFGIAYQPDERWTFVADGRYEPWTHARTTFNAVDGGPSAFPLFGNRSFADRVRASVGAEVLPAGEESVASFPARVIYRLGGYYEQSYATPTPSRSIESYGVTAGLSFPTGAFGTRVDLTIDAGVRGTQQRSLVRDLFLTTTLTLNVGERWFQERKLR
jgi:hypothetical protein